jgi:hypothetical protein
MHLPDDLFGETLVGVRELVFDPDEEGGLPMREAVALDLSTRSLVIEALTDTSEILVRVGDLQAVDPEQRVRDASSDAAFQCFVGSPLRNWWIADNDAGYTDCFIVAFTRVAGLLFVAMNNEISVLAVSGEQFS